MLLLMMLENKEEKGIMENEGGVESGTGESRGRVIYSRRGKRQRWGWVPPTSVAREERERVALSINGPRFLTPLSFFHPHPPLSDVI